MKVDIKVPAMGESIAQATIGAFLKPEGTQVAADEELLELETDKVNQVLYAPQAGVIHWKAASGDTVKIGDVIGYVDTEEKGAAAQPQAAAPPKGAKAPQKAQKPKEEPVLAPPAQEKSARLKKEEYIADLEKEEPQQKEQAPKPAVNRGETRQKMSKIRKIIANRLVEVLRQTAMLTTFNEVDMTQIIALREAYREPFEKKHGVRLGYMPFFVKAAVSALKAFPEVNAYLSEDEIVARAYYDIGIAIGTERGLIVPVVRDCDRLSFAEIERSIESHAKKAREGGLEPGDLQGGSFTITNGGTYGSLLSTPILNPPQCAILGMHKIMKRAVVVDDQIAIRQMMYLALSYDHRIIDGKEAVSFLVHIKNCLEDPSRLLLGV